LEPVNGICNHQICVAILNYKSEKEWIVLDRLNIFFISCGKNIIELFDIVLANV